MKERVIYNEIPLVGFKYLGASRCHKIILHEFTLLDVMFFAAVMDHVIRRSVHDNGQQHCIEPEKRLLSLEERDEIIKRLESGRGAEETRKGENQCEIDYKGNKYGFEFNLRHLYTIELCFLQKHPPAIALKLHCRPSRVRAEHVGPAGPLAAVFFLVAAETVVRAAVVGGV